MLDTAGDLEGRGAGAGPDGAVRDPGEPRRRRAVVAGHGRAACRVAHAGRPARRRPDLHPRPDVPAAHAVVVDGDRRGQAGRRAVRDPGALPVGSTAAPVLDELLDVIRARTATRSCPVHIEIYQGPTGTALVPTRRRVAPRERAVALRRRRRPARSSRARRRVRRHRDEGARSTRLGQRRQTRLSDRAGLAEGLAAAAAALAFGLLIENPAPWRPSL